MLKVDRFKDILSGESPKVAVFEVNEEGFQTEEEVSVSSFLELAEQAESEVAPKFFHFWQMANKKTPGKSSQLSLILDNKDGGSAQFEILEDEKGLSSFTETLKEAVKLSEAEMFQPKLKLLNILTEPQLYGMNLKEEFNGFRALGFDKNNAFLTVGYVFGGEVPTLVVSLWLGSPEGGRFGFDEQDFFLEFIGESPDFEKLVEVAEKVAEAMETDFDSASKVALELGFEKL